MNKDYYKILGLTKTATEEDIKQSYRKMAMLFHPDRNTDIGSEDKFKEIKEAYEYLSDPANLRKEPKTIADFERAFGNTSAPTRKRKSNIVTISLHDAYTGRTVIIDDDIIVIPKGIRPSTKLFVNGRLYKIEIQTDSKFKRSNDDLLVDVTITAIEAIIGINATLDHLDGVQLQFFIPAGIQPGQVIRLAGKGMKNPEFDTSWDVLVRIGIIIPKSLTAEQIASVKLLGHRENINIWGIINGKENR